MVVRLRRSNRRGKQSEAQQAFAQSGNEHGAVGPSQEHQPQHPSDISTTEPDGPGVHVAYAAAERSGLVTVGIGPRAGEDELRHLLTKTGASALLSRARHRDVDAGRLVEELRGQGLPLRHHLAVDGALREDAAVTCDGAELPEPSASDREALLHPVRPKNPIQTTTNMMRNMDVLLVTNS